MSMQHEVNEIRGIVFEQYPNIASFARAMHWDRKKASRIINQKQKPSAKDMEQMADCLNIKDVFSFVHIFLPSLSTMCQEDVPPDPFDFGR